MIEESPLQEAITVLQLETIDELEKEIETLKEENKQRRVQNAILKETHKNLSALINEMENDQKEEKERILQEHKESIEEIKTSNLEKLTEIKEEYEETIEKIEASYLKKLNDLEKVQEEEVTRIKQTYEENIVELKKANLQREKYLENKLEGKNSIVQYVLNVLRKSEDLLKMWQTTVTQQAEHLVESEQKLKIALTVKETISKQTVAITKLEDIILNNKNLTKSFENIEKNCPAKNNC